MLTLFVIYMQAGTVKSIADFDEQLKLTDTQSKYIHLALIHRAA